MWILTVLLEAVSPDIELDYLNYYDENYPSLLASAALLPNSDLPCKEDICFKCSAINTRHKTLRREFPRLVRSCRNLWRIENCCDVYRESLSRGLLARKDCFTVPGDLSFGLANFSQKHLLFNSIDYTV